MRILYVANEWDYGDRAGGARSYEHYNFYESLVALGHEVIYFDYQQMSSQFGQDAMNAALESHVDALQPDLLFACFMYDEVSRALMRRISDRLPTLLWLCDDHWRWESFSCQWAPQFRWVVTTASDAPAKYEAMGYHGAIKSQWGAGPGYERLDLPLLYDVTFVGRAHGDRWRYLQPLRDAGVNVRVWGPEHGEGRLTQEEMVRVFNQSRINLNFSESAQPGYRQIKGRHFEIPACGGFQLTNLPDDNFLEYFTADEVGVFRDPIDLVDQVEWWLAHPTERAKVAAAGHLRVMRDHTYARRFGDIFARMGL